MENNKYYNLKDVPIALLRKINIYSPPLARYMCEKCENNGHYEAFDIEPYKMIICPFCGNTDDDIEFMSYED